MPSSTVFIFVGGVVGLGRFVGIGLFFDSFKHWTGLMTTSRLRRRRPQVGFAPKMDRLAGKNRAGVGADEVGRCSIDPSPMNKRETTKMMNIIPTVSSASPRGVIRIIPYYSASPPRGDI